MIEIDFTLKKKINLLFICTLVIIISIALFIVNKVLISQISLQTAKRNLATGYKILDVKYPGGWKNENGVLYKGNTPIKNNFLIAQDIAGALTNEESSEQIRVAVFADNKVADANIGIDYSISEKIERKVLNQGGDYHNIVEIKNKRYHTSYIPIRNNSGKIIGIWSVGVPENLVDGVMENIFFWVVFILIISLILVQFILSFSINKLLFIPLNKIIMQTKKISNGNLKGQVNLNRDDEIGDLEEAINKMTVILNKIIAGIHEMGKEVLVTSKTLSNSNQQTSASIEEISATTRNFTNKIKESNQLTQEMAGKTTSVTELAEDGLEKMRSTKREIEATLSNSEEATEVIEGLEGISYEIQDITTVISDIAEQTNLLALNASIEAAREKGSSTDGQSGQGFAVVAQEIRELAERTQNSTNNIKETIEKLINQTMQAVNIIQENNDQIKNRVQNINQTEVLFQNIVNQIDELNDCVQQVATSSSNILNSSQEISEATEEQNQAIQQVSSSSRELNEMVKQLNALIEKFEVEN
ncbi:methyl-accepting chemotaxis protein TlpC [Halanaerocella petrolearia]